MFNIKSVVYPEKIAKRLARSRRSGAVAGDNGTATNANFACGSFIRFSMSIDIEDQFVADAHFSSNGCGYMIAAADVLAESVIERRLTGLHGLTEADLNERLLRTLGDIPVDRRDCVSACITALRAAFVDLRSRRIAEFQGERALVCTCFGITEETVEAAIENKSLKTVDEVAQVCRAGAGCGSCRMLIQEMLDESSGRI